MPLNLEAIAATVEQYMLDTVRVYSVKDRTFDQSTGQYVTERETIYEGKCFVGPMGTPGRTTVGMTETPSRMMYEMGLPKTASGIEPEMFAVVLTSTWNPAMVGKVFRIDGEVESTFHAHRRVTMRRDDSRHED